MSNTRDKEKIAKLIAKSGNGFHARVAHVLKTHEWSVVVSPYYSDNFTDKPREIDIAAEKSFHVNDDLGHYLGVINVRLLIECKYITSPTVFWVDAKDQERAVKLVVKEVRLSNPKENTNTLGHHYLSRDSVAKLISTEKSLNNNESEYEPINKAINQCLNALICYRNRPDIVLPRYGEPSKILQRVTYPIIAVNSFENFYRIDMDDNAGKFDQIKKPFQLELNYAYTDRDRTPHTEYFLVDVVSMEKLLDFLISTVQSDVAVINQKFSSEERFRGSAREHNLTTPNRAR